MSSLSSRGPVDVVTMSYRSSEDVHVHSQQPSIIIVVDLAVDDLHMLLLQLLLMARPTCHINSAETSSARNPATCNRRTPLPSRTVFLSACLPTDRLVFINTYQVCWSTGSLTASRRARRAPASHDLILFSPSPARHSRRRRRQLPVCHVDEFHFRRANHITSLPPPRTHRTFSIGL